jgi:hypothetical protein
MKLNRAAWADVVQWAHRSYLGTGTAVSTHRRGRFLGAVRCDVTTARRPLFELLREGDATFAAGTRLFQVRDLPVARALLVQRAGGYVLFQAPPRRRVS